ncbi:MAG: putative VapC ribonuclease [Archaeoglobus fulgidus]|uniref:Ribonuclease VapC n=1 Tax=Archaeoglobus fulgidus TaxID=2234 RepID=A0A101DDD5_ARCFL|nr:PIN domain-containing protein [Archaeoglobus fulgidus]KUJ93462.1 MAG: putative VapC ribonuclease [Archaeoglobus fulgidus]KUK05756.1 MAG: putative VapC ribonuclease [Archaeoglobus fulgidus]
MAALIDTGIFFGFYSLKDVHHMDSVAIVVHAVEGKWGRLFVTNHILDETLTLLKYRKLPADKFLEGFVESGVLNIIYTDEEVEKKALEVFKARVYEKGFSYTDAISEVVAEELKLRLISYDSGFSLPTIGRDYWKSLDESERKRISAILREKGIDR